MPNPLSSVNPGANVLIGNVGPGASALAQRPLLALKAILVIESWANVEGFMLRLFAALLGGSESMAAEIYLRLDTKGPKSAAINAAADFAFKSRPELKKLLTAIQQIEKTNGSMRDRVAHWTWGHSPELPQALLLVDPRAIIGINMDRSKVLVYNERDFDDIIAANNRLCGYAQQMQFIVMGHVGNEDNSIYDRLCNEPEIQDRLSRLV
jgi:hypothetical protein